MKAIIIANGNYLDKEEFLKLYNNEDYIICADGGLNYAFDIGLKPNLLLGDLDSVDKECLSFYEHIEIMKYNPEKDYTDTELAIKIAIKKGYTNIILICATGTRLDHTGANIYLIEKYYNNNINIKIIDNNNIICGIRGKKIIYKSDVKFRNISLLPVTKEINIEYLRGLKYTLDNKVVSRGSTLCISNEIIEEKVEINITVGFALLIFSND